MSDLLERLARPEILALPPVDIAAQANELFSSTAIKLDANENPFPPLVDGSLAANVNRYPEPQPAALRLRAWSSRAVRTMRSTF
jgi:histidinol-phosphate/aromatic aminotransferase/cobyric acid decarboxylase-like protein